MLFLALILNLDSHFFTIDTLFILTNLSCLIFAKYYDDIYKILVFIKRSMDL